MWRWGAFKANKSNSKIFAPKTKKDSYGYTAYKFPIRAKNIDFGTLVIERGGERIEVPFEYKYFKFWY